MSRGLKPTFSELRYSIPSDLARQWREDASTKLLAHVWSGYDLLRADLSEIDTTEASRSVETNLTQLLCPRIQKTFGGFEPYYLNPEFYEYETQRFPRGRPPQYDMAFVWRENERFAWPLEAKDLPSEDHSGSIAEYVNEIHANFCTCRYAPFSSEAAMLGYLLSGDPDKALSNIADAVPCAMTKHPDFLERSHRTSDHPRTVPEGKNYPAEIRIHHLMMPISSSTSNDS